jgi:hypothetical protein
MGLVSFLALMSFETDTILGFLGSFLQQMPKINKDEMAGVTAGMVVLGTEVPSTILCIVCRYGQG